MKKFLALLIMAALVLPMIPWSTPAQAEDVPTFVVTLATNTLVTDYEDNRFTKWLEEDYGCNIEFNFLPASDSLQKLTVMVAGDEYLGDLLYGILNKPSILQFADAGALYPLNEFVDKYDTNLEAFSAEIGEDLVAAVTTADGDIWGYPTYYPETNNMTKYRAWINTVWLDNLGLAMPTTTDELYDVLVAFRDQDANGNGDPNDEIPMLGSASWSANPCVFLTNAYVYWDDVEDLIIKDGKIDAAFTQEEYKEALKYMNKLVADGLLSADTFSITEGQYREYLSTETPTVGISFYTHLGFVGPTDDNKNEYQYLPYLIGADGEQRVSYQPYDTSSMQCWFIPTSAKDPDASFQFIDWLWKDDWAYIHSRFGFEGEDYEAVTDPETLALLKSNHDFAILEHDVGWGEACNMSWQVNMGRYTGSSYMCQWNGDPNYYFYKRVVAVDDMMSKVPGPGEYVPALTYTSEETDEYNELRSNIRTFWDEYRTRFILGDLDIDSNWDSYISTLNNEMNLPRFLEMVQTAYDRTYGG